MDQDLAIRYRIEQEVLPAALYNEGPRLMAALMCSAGKCMVDCFRNAEQEEQGYVCPYSEKDFSVYSQVYNKEKASVLIMRIGMPEPDLEPLSRAIYLCYGNKAGYELYLTSELSGKAAFSLCGRLHNGNHIMFGKVPNKPSREMEMAAELYWDAMNMHCSNNNTPKF